MELRLANMNEVDKLTFISTQAFNTDHTVGGKKNDGPPNYDSIDWHMQMYQENHLYTLIDDGMVLGGAILFLDGTKLYVGRIFISPMYFGRGYGLKLMKLIEEFFPYAFTIELDTPIWNMCTNQFYKKCGYTEVKRDQESVYYVKEL